MSFDGARFRVGPQSAGANPGPASYRRGGPLAVTDANVMLGKIVPHWFPKVFGASGQEALSAEVVREKFSALAAQTGRSAEDVAEGFIRIAVQQMANAIKKISVARGYDVTRYTLQCFGGAGGQHACLVADALGMTRVLVHPLAGVLSAYGMGLADQSLMREQAVEMALQEPEALPQMAAQLQTLAGQAQQALAEQQLGHAPIRVQQRVHVRYEGTDLALVVPFGSLQDIVGGRLPPALCLFDAGQAPDGRSRFGGGRDCWRRASRGEPSAQRAARGAAARDGAPVPRRPVARGGLGGA